ncbi:MAG TPA: transposase [Pyrinomonadaceae bacterium]|nr:transposase [Pyrinomonadaceae bacterium]
MTLYIGVDFHARAQTISYLTTEEGEIQRAQLDHGKLDEVRSFYQQFAGQHVVVGFESSGYAAWFEELLEELGYEIWIGHATAIRLFARRRQKNDRRDADLILDLLWRGDFPRIHRYAPEPGSDTATALSPAAGENADDGGQQPGVHGLEPRGELTHPTEESTRD